MSSTVENAPSSSPQREPEGRQLPRRWSTLAVLVSWAAVSTVLLTTTAFPLEYRVGILAGGDDFDTYRDGARHLEEGLPLCGEPLTHLHLYTYPPFSTVTFLPFGLLPRGPDQYISMAANLVALVGIVALCWRMLGYRITLRRWRFDAAGPRVYVPRAGPNDAVLRADQPDADAGGAVGHLARRAQPAQGHLGRHCGRHQADTGLLRAVLPVATAVAGRGCGALDVRRNRRVGLDRPADRFPAVLDRDAVRYRADRRRSLHPANQCLRSAMARLAAGPPTSAVADMPGEPPPTWLWLLAAACVVAVSMTIAALLYPSGERLLAVTVTGLSTVVVSPFSWGHHWVWFVPVIVYIVHRALTNGWRWLVAASLFVVLGAWPYRFPVDTEPRIGLFMFPGTWVDWDVLVNLYVLLYAGIMIGAAVIAIRKTRSRRRDPAYTAISTAEAD